MSHDHPQPPRQFTGRTALVVGGSVVGLASVLALTRWLVSSSQETAATPTTQPRLLTIDELRAADQQRLTSFGWVDRPKGVVRIPIELAIDKTIVELRRPTTAPATRPGF